MANMYQLLNPEEIQVFRNQGFSDADIQKTLNEVEQETSLSPLQQSYQQAMSKTDPRSFASNSVFSTQQHDNLIKWQLELDSILERVEHMLRGDRPKFKDGHMIWTPAEESEDKILNEFGVSEIMRILSMYLNRNTILSNYDEETINFKVYDFGMEIADLFFLKYETMGLDTLEKRKLYPMLVRELVDQVHSSYLRALHGGERQSLHEARTVTQSEPLTPGVNINMTGGRKERSIINPARYVVGRYKG